MHKSDERVVAVVDDDPSMLGAIGALLDAYGFRTLLFASAEEFLAQDGAAKAQCLLLDIKLGGISGIQLHKQLTQTGSGLPIIFMTALDDVETHTEAISAGCIAFLRKPFVARRLIEAIERSLS